uniref:Uncharacterized protein n=1 Tax=Rhizophora mucronata TaxID=61149 RepID=A0A2P2N3K1_RHIMU
MGSTHAMFCLTIFARTWLKNFEREKKRLALA